MTIPTVGEVGLEPGRNRAANPRGTLALYPTYQGFSGSGPIGDALETTPTPDTSNLDASHHV